MAHGAQKTEYGTSSGGTVQLGASSLVATHVLHVHAVKHGLACETTPSCLLPSVHLLERMAMSCTRNPPSSLRLAANRRCS